MLELNKINIIKDLRNEFNDSTFYFDRRIKGL